MMACQSCTRDEICIACRFDGREARLSRYAGRRGEMLLRRGDKAPLDYFAEAEDSPSWQDAQDETPPARRTATQTADHDFKARR